VRIALPALNSTAADACRAHLDRLTKPQGSLGRIEDLAVRLAAICGFPPSLEKPHVLVFAADHGVTEEGVSAFPRAVTAQMVLNFLRGGAAINVLARLHGAAMTVADVGVDFDFADAVPSAGVAFRAAKVRRGSRNLCREDAMLSAEFEAALRAGADAANAAIDSGADCICVGEMGIGNTTAASALTAAILNLPTEQLCGRGTGVDDAGYARKKKTIALAVERFRKSGRNDPAETFAALGGLELAGIAGACGAAAARGVPVLVDGFIASSSALAADRMWPGLKHFLFFAHQSAEPGHAHILRALDEQPLLDLSLRLGEGTGAVLAIPLLRAACAIIKEMATFDSAGVSKSSKP